MTFFLLWIVKWELQKIDETNNEMSGDCGCQAPEKPTNHYQSWCYSPGLLNSYNIAIQTGNLGLIKSYLCLCSVQNRQMCLVIIFKTCENQTAFDDLQVL